MTPADGPRVVALGGGHGLAASLRALRQVTPHLTAVVTVADDGGSSGRLRREMDVLPPGDLRMALAALAGDGEAEQCWTTLLQHRFPAGGPLHGHAVGNLVLTGLAQTAGGTVAALAGDGEAEQCWTTLLQHRFPAGGPLHGHAVGNLVLTGLAQTAGGTVAALDRVGTLVGAVGRVLPASTDPLDIVAQVVGLDPREPNVVREVVGQHAVATTPGTVLSVRLRPDEPEACAEAVAAVRAADWVVLGPGSWFTSVLTHLLVPGLRVALRDTPARRLVALNLSPQAGETAGYTPEAHLHVLSAHAPDVRLDVVLADPDAVEDLAALQRAAAVAQAEVVLAPVSTQDGSPRHDPDRLAAAYRAIFSGDDHQGPRALTQDRTLNAWR